MLKNLKNRIVMTFDPVYDASDVAKVGEIVEGDFKFVLSGNRVGGLEEVLLSVKLRTEI